MYCFINSVLPLHSSHTNILYSVPVLCCQNADILTNFLSPFTKEKMVLDDLLTGHPVPWQIHEKLCQLGVAVAVVQ